MCSYDRKCWSGDLRKFLEDKDRGRLSCRGTSQLCRQCNYSLKGHCIQRKILSNLIEFIDKNDMIKDQVDITCASHV